eukprot:86907-Hanusia_phi.AAC.9
MIGTTGNGLQQGGGEGDCGGIFQVWKIAVPVPPFRTGGHWQQSAEGLARTESEPSDQCHGPSVTRSAGRGAATQSRARPAAGH